MISDWGCLKVVARELNIEIIRGFSEESSLIIRALMLYAV